MWRVKLKGYFYSLDLGEFGSVDEALDEVRASYGNEWSEIYDGKGGYANSEEE